MGKLSRAAAEERGWVIFHEQEERTEFIANRPQVIPASYRAEKAIDESHKLTEEGETIGLLLERIESAEANLAGVPPFANSEVNLPTVTVTDEDGNESEAPAGEVLVLDEAGDVTKLPEDVFASRAHNEALVLPHDPDPEDEEDDRASEMVFVGPVEQAVVADQAKHDLEGQLTDEQFSQEPVEAENVQIENDPDAVDAPGRSGGSSLIVPAAQLGSQEYDEADNALVKGESSEIPEPHESVAGQEKAAAVEAAEDKAKELRDEGKEVGPAQEASQAGAEAAQKAHEEGTFLVTDGEEEGPGGPLSDVPHFENLPEPGLNNGSDEDESDQEPDATEAAEKLAKEKDVDLSEVEGSGKEGRVTKADVEKALEDENQD